MPRKRRKPSQILGDQLPELRKIAGARDGEGLTQTALADRLRRLGSALDATAIAKIETTTSKRRGVSLDEALEIAAALGVSPMHLFFPREARAMVQVAPKLNVPLERATAWLAGQIPLPGFDSDRELLVFDLARSEDEKEMIDSMEHVSREQLEKEELAKITEALRIGLKELNRGRQRTATRHRKPKEGGTR